MKSLQTGHAIIYNHYFIETIQATREEHVRKAVTEKLQVFFGDNYPQFSNAQSKLFFNMNALITALSQQNDTDMEHFACSETIDCMLSYYKVCPKLSSHNQRGAANTKSIKGGQGEVRR